MRRRIVAALVLALIGLASTPFAADFEIPDGFFFGYPQPNNTIELTFTQPKEGNPESLARDAGWWRAVAKFELLTERGRADPTFLAALIAAKNDPDLQATGVTYVQWSGGTAEEKLAYRKRIHEAIERIVVKHRLRELLSSTPIDEKLLAERIAKNQAATAQQSDTARTATLAAPKTNLVEYCPGIEGNIKLNKDNPLFPRLTEILKDPEADRAFQAGAERFRLYLDRNPNATVHDRNEKLNAFLSPILDRL